MAKLKLVDKIKMELKSSLTKVSKGAIEKKSQKNAKSKSLAKDIEEFDDYSDEAPVTSVTTNQNIQADPRNNDGFLGESEDSGPDFIANSDVRTTPTINNIGLLGLDNNGDIFVIGESGNSVDDLVHSFQQTTIS